MRLIRQNVYYVLNKGIFTQFSQKIKQKGVMHLFSVACKIVKELFFNYLQYLLFKTFKSERTFKFENEDLHYFCNLYNTTWKNERAVEVPVIRNILKQYKGKRILEIGNVLQHYCMVNHTILDKYEKGCGVINEDIVKFHPDKKYDLIVSISTFEHVGYDEDVKDSSKILQGMDNLRSLLSDKGRAFITFPLGYNPFLDQFLKEGRMKFTKIYCFKKISKDNKWLEAKLPDIREVKYNFPFPCNNFLVIGVIEK